jgi:hypothetical protein
MKHNTGTRFLVLSFGLYQACHILFNIRAGIIFTHSGLVGFPALPPAGGWSPDMLNVYIDMALMDTLNALLSLLFVWGYFRRQPWCIWLGTITVTLSFYAAILFNFTACQAGAWAGVNLWVYLFINITYLPVVILWILLLLQGYQSFIKCTV